MWRNVNFLLRWDVREKSGYCVHQLPLYSLEAQNSNTWNDEIFHAFASAVTAEWEDAGTTRPDTAEPCRVRDIHHSPWHRRITPRGEPTGSSRRVRAFTWSRYRAIARLPASEISTTASVQQHRQTQQVTVCAIVFECNIRPWVWPQTFCL